MPAGLLTLKIKGLIIAVVVGPAAVVGIDIVDLDLIAFLRISAVAKGQLRDGIIPDADDILRG